MKEQLSPSGPTLPPLWESSECSALLMNIKKKNNAVTRIGHYLLFVLARCANCQKRDTSVSTGSWKKIWGFQFEHKAESNFFWLLMLTVTLLLRETVQEHKETHSVCIRLKHEEKVIKLFWNSSQLGQVLFHLQWKIRASEQKGFLRPCFSSELHESACVIQPSTLTTIPQLWAPQVFFLDFDAHCLFVCQNDIMPNQGVFQILITLLGVHYLCERAQTAIKPALGKRCAR